MPSIYELSPPLLAMSAHRIDSPVSNLAIAYEHDAKFFADYPQRQTLIREAFMGEFDLKMPNAEWLQMPRLWCLVSQIAPGTLSVVPVYRGSKFWSFVPTDAALASILVEIARREGIDVEEFRAFERKTIVKNRKAVSNGIVH